ncbi:MAG: lipid A biosynthesis (KDO)2-(lauroyl)-lipid IVA acyltransferase [Tannerella sp.]|jgi:predicted LPLAT superfamily acyltransferase|nr:lipid A biosynthesis (KDO)2-(lauroyl)-lipid IVA acyltransferase [Tannerella sp.]
MAREREWKGRTGGSLTGQMALIVFFRCLDVRLGYAVMACVVPFYMLFSRRACNAIYRFFRHRLGRTRCQALAGTYRNHYAFGQVILDRFAVFAGRRSFFEVETVGDAHFRRLVAGEKGFVVAGAHVGNFEICGYLLDSGPKRINALVYAGETRTVQENRARALERRNVGLIPVADDMSHLFAVHAALQRGEIVSMTCDRAQGQTRTVECDFLGGRAAFPVGAFALAAGLDVEVIAIFVIKRTARRYTVYVRPLAPAPPAGEARGNRERAAQYARAYARELEDVARRHPEQWFNYYEFWNK